MLDAIRRYGTLLVAALLAGLVGGTAAGWMQSPRAVAGPLLSVTESPITSLVVVVVAVGVLAALAIATARLVNSAVGLFVLGWGVAVMAMRSGTIVDAALLGDVSAIQIASETLLFAVLVAFASIAIWRVGGPLEDIHHPNDRFHGMISAVRAPQAWRGLCAALLAVPVVLLLARTTTTGQSLGAAAVAGLVVGVFGRMWAPRSQPVHLAALAIALLGIAQLLLGGAFPGGSGAGGSGMAGSGVGGVGDAAVVSGAIPRMLRVMPMEIAGGVVAGVAMGLGWARSFVTVGDDEVESSASAVAKPLRSARTS